MTNKIYKIEYGNSVYYKSSKRGKNYHISRLLTKRQAELLLKRLNKKWDYTTVYKLKNGIWEVVW